MSSKTVLARAIEVVAFLFAAFGHALVNIAPPEEGDTTFAVGIGSLLALCVLLFISAVSKNLPRRKFKRRWLLAAGVFFAVTLTSVFFYFSNLNTYTFRYPPETLVDVHIGGGEAFTPLAQDRRTMIPNEPVASLVSAFGGVEYRERVWTDESLRDARMILTVNYVLLVLSLAATIFCLTEGILVDPRPK